MLPVIASSLRILGSNVFEARCTGEEESVTCTVKLDEPALVGVPLIVPPTLKLRPAGNAPEVTVHEYGVVPPVAARVNEYAVPTIPFGTEAVVIVSVGALALMLMENGLVAFCTGEEESVTCTVKLDWPAPVGVPLIVPFLLKLRPAGNAPDVTVHEYGVAPPEAANVVEYAVPTVPLGAAVVPITTPFRGFTLIEKAACAVCDGVEESETCTVKLNWPDAVGVPLTTPVVFDNDNPDVNVPDTTMKLYGAMPPVTFKVAEYADPTAAVAKLPPENCIGTGLFVLFVFFELELEERPLQPLANTRMSTMKPSTSSRARSLPSSGCMPHRSKSRIDCLDHSDSVSVTEDHGRTPSKIGAYSTSQRENGLALRRAKFGFGQDSTDSSHARARQTNIRYVAQCGNRAASRERMKL